MRYEQRRSSDNAKKQSEAADAPIVELF